MVELIVLLWLGREIWAHSKAATKGVARTKNGYNHAMGLEDPKERQAQLAHYVAYSGQANVDALCAHIFMAAFAVVVALGWRDISDALRPLVHL